MFGVQRYVCGVDLWYRHPDGDIVPLFGRLWLAEKVGQGAGRQGCRHLFWRFWWVPDGPDVAVRCDLKEAERHRRYIAQTQEAPRGSLAGRP